MVRTIKISTKRFIKKKMLDIGLLNPASQGRHGLVGNLTLAEMKRKFQISFLKADGLLPEHQFLDFGCGTLRGGIPIIAYLHAGNYYGIDVRINVLDEAKKELLAMNLQNKNPVLLTRTEADSKLSNIKFDRIWSFSVLFHLDNLIFRNSLEFIANHLEVGGKFQANVNIGNDLEREWQGFPIVTRPLNFYEQAAAQCNLKVQVLGSLESLGHISGKPPQDQQIMLEFTHK